MSELILENYRFPAAILPATQDELRARAIERRAIDASTLDGETPYFFSAEISNNKLDSYFTRMAQTTLRNYAEDAATGVSFLYAHDNAEVIGRSTDGRFVGGQGNGVARVEADFFAVPGLRLGAVESDQVIRALRLGVIRDVSVGFYGGELLCSICGRDIMRDWECRHYPGFKYEVEHDGKTEETTCTADVENARLAEVSGVYKGSTPGAVVLKAERDAAEGIIKPEARQLIEQRYRIHLPDRRVVVPGVGEGTMSTKRETAENPPAEEEKPVQADPPADTEPEGETDEQRSVRELVTRAGLPAETAHKSPLSALRAVVAECERLRPLADAGTRYTERLREKVVQEQVRAVGRASEAFKAMVSRASDIELVALLEDLGAKGDEIFTGGRQTKDAPDSTQAPERRIPNAAHAG